MKNILIVSNSYDLHAELVEPIIRSKGAKVFRLNLDQFPKEYEFDLQYHGETMSGELRHLPTNTYQFLHQIDSVWLRKDAEFAFLNDSLAPQEKAFAKDETEHLLFSLLYSLPVFWMNHPKAFRGAMWKGEQMQRAAKLGFKVPRTLITNRPDAVRNFKQQVNQDIIFKAMSSPYLAAEQVDANEVVATSL